MEDVIVSKSKEIINKINDKWIELQKNNYICYSVKELAYKVNYDLLDILGNNSMDVYPLYKLYGDKHKIIFEIDNDIFFAFDIWWEKNFLTNECWSKVGNGKLLKGIPKGYKWIDEVIEDEE